MTDRKHDPKEQVCGVKPYILRAYIDCIEDLGKIPYIRFVTELSPGTVLPPSLQGDEVVTLDVSHEGCTSRFVGNHFIDLDVQFNGSPYSLRITVASVLAVFSEDGEVGTLLPLLMMPDQKIEEVLPIPEGPENVLIREDSVSPTPPRPPRGKPNLRIVK